MDDGDLGCGMVTGTVAVVVVPPARVLIAHNYRAF